MLKTAKNIYELLKEQHIEKYKGKLTLELMDISVRLTDKSVIGYVFQEWLASWFKKNNIDFEVNSNSQEFPDFYLSPGQKEDDLLEIKTFDLEASANFDIANFEAYCRSLESKAYRVDADYLIFGYTFKNSNLIIEKIWLKKIWEITSPSEQFPIKTQTKQNTIYNIRPCTWESDRSRYKAFGSRKKFIEALYNTQKIYKKTAGNQDLWLKKVKKSYTHFKKKSLL